MDDHVTQTELFTFFWRGWPSQWYRSNFVVAGVSYNCPEQYMMAEKARIFGDVETLDQIVRASSPKAQKALGRAVRGFHEATWNSVCRGVVYSGNLAKFSQDPDLAQKLLETGARTIVEASPVDALWGIGMAVDNPAIADPQQWPGKNWLGIALMQVRQTLWNQARGEPIVLDPDLQKQMDVRATLGTAT